MCSEHKGTDQLCSKSYCTADLCLFFVSANCCFSHAKVHFIKFKHLLFGNLTPIKLAE